MFDDETVPLDPAVLLAADELHAEIAIKKCRSCGEWDVADCCVKG